ncbi:MAG: PKD domain-containing protein [bacterium]|nr:PKD domain-containing protein [bacterium]
MSSLHLVRGAGLALMLAGSGFSGLVAQCSTPVTRSFSHTGGLQTWTAPAGVDEVTITARGARGGASHSGNPGGRGARLTATVPIPAGATLVVLVGGSGGALLGGGSGGGGTFVAVGSAAADLGDPLVAAGGGGGGHYTQAGAGHGGATLHGHGIGGAGGTQAGGGGGGRIGSGFFGTYSGVVANGGVGAFAGGAGGSSYLSLPGGFGGGGGAAYFFPGGGGGATGGNAGNLLGPAQGGTSTWIGSATNVSHTAGGHSGSNGSVTISYLTKLECDFSVDVAAGGAPHAVTFSDLSSTRHPGGVTSWAWDFDNDGTVDSTVQNPQHVYTVGGSYDVALTVTDAVCTQTAVKSAFIASQCTTVAGFAINSPVGPLPHAVTFTDQSTTTHPNGITSWAWDFENDGTIDSTAQNPQHTYLVPGTYDVRLTVTDGFCPPTTLLRNALVTAECTTVADFTADDVSGPPPHTVTFTDQSTTSHPGGITSWAWDFDGDGTTDSTQQFPTHTFPFGTFSVSLTVTDGYCAPQTRARTDYITSRCGQEWSGLGGGITGTMPNVAVRSTLWLANGDLVVGGYFTSAGGVPCSNIARWDGSSWHPLGAGVDGDVQAIAELPNGDIIVGGNMRTAGSAAVNYTARWNGSSWSAFGNATGTVSCLLVLPDGSLLVGGPFGTMNGILCGGIIRWTGSSWQPLGSGTDGAVRDMARMPNGDIVVVGSFQVAGTAYAPNIARWDGNVWTGFGVGADARINAVAALPNSDVLVGGAFFNIGGVRVNFLARWDGGRWVKMGSVGANSYVHDFVHLPNGDVAVIGSFTSINYQANNRVAIWGGGGTFRPAGSGLDNSAIAGVASPNGDLFVAGFFDAAGGNPANGVARLARTCPSTQISIPSGCTGPAAGLQLASSGAPWTGETWSTSCTTFGPLSLGVAVVGLGAPAAPLPLGALHPTGVSGCVLAANSDAVLLMFPQNGRASYSLTIPAGPALGGLELSHQFLELELDAGANLQSIRSSNALHVDVGFF